MAPPSLLDSFTEAGLVGVICVGDRPVSRRHEVAWVDRAANLPADLRALVQ